MADSALTFKAGDVIFVQGENPSGLFMLQNGTLEILSASDEYDGLDRSIIISKSVRVGLISGKALLSGFSDHLSGAYRKSLRAVTDATVARYPIPRGGIQGFADSDPGQALNILKHVNNNIKTVGVIVAKYTKLYQTVCMMSDNMALMYREMSETNASERLHRNAEEIHKKFKSKGGSFPAEFDARFLIVDNSPSLDKKYLLPEAVQEHPGTKYDDFILRTLQLDQNVVISMFRSDPTMASSMYDGLSESLISSLDRVQEICHFVDNELAILFGDDDSWASYLVDRGGLSEWERSGKCSADFVKNLLSLVVKLNALYEELCGRKMTALFPGIRKIHGYYSSARTGGETATKREAPAVISTGALNKSIHQIFEFALMPKDFRTKLLKSLNEFKSAKNPFNTEPEGRKLRRQITALYWDLYKQAYIRSRSESAVPRPVQMMLSFGFLDEGLLEESQVTELSDLSRSREKSRDIPVLMETEFLNMIYEGKVEPSITEMGLTYQGHLEEMEKHKSRKEREEEQKVDENIGKVMYEIGQRLATTSAICSGSTATAFPILTALMVRGSLKQIYNNKQKIETITKEVRNIDFSVFYRETVLKIGEAREIIQEEVVPYFILLPIFGSRTLLWQDMTGTNKRSRGRIVVPIFFMGDLMKSLVHTFASFRWELNRDIKGAMWADPIEGGVTGEYFDYANTFKKMSKLSQEAKEKIEEKFRSIRNNRDRFADDYIQWVMYEKDGIMKLNNVVREMFFRHIPFRKELRGRLESMPAFTQPATRYKNIHKKEVEAYERRFKKYQDDSGQLPEELKKFFEFLDL
ncbi:MAG: cyclic nucleotide-binding domain-containing protein [Spirochaetes bacterium]|nr:cyclic nucleotide-binding domain-containing protein [Spirochaetota bacterium]